MMGDLLPFLLDRIAEDEEWARRALEVDERFPDAAEVTYRWWRDVNYPFGGRSTTSEAGAPSPARVLAECEAKRRIVLMHEPYDSGWLGRRPTCWVCSADGWPCLTLAVLSLPYANHPDYREEWRPR